MSTATAPTPAQVRRWRRYLAAERAEASLYRELAQRREGEEKEILLALAEAEGRHERHWLQLLGDKAGNPRRDIRTVMLHGLARRFGSVFLLALAQRAESQSPYTRDPDATPAMAADERIHEEVVRALAVQGRLRLSGTFRAAVFGANDGLVSNLALILGFAASGAPKELVLLSGFAGLLAGALSMGAGEYVSVRSQRELLESSKPTLATRENAPSLDVDANELALVYRARGMSAADADARAAKVLAGQAGAPVARAIENDSVGSAFGAALSSFLFFASGAIIPVLPFLFGAEGTVGVLIAAGLVGLALLGTGSVVGLLSGASPLKRALRQLAIGFGAAAVTYMLGLAFGVSVG